VSKACPDPPILRLHLQSARRRGPQSAQTDPVRAVASLWAVPAEARQGKLHDRLAPPQLSNDTQEADLFDLFGQENTDRPDKYAKLALRAAMADVFAYCYLNDYNNTLRNSSTDFVTRVLSHLLTHDLAHRFEIPGLVELTSQYFRNAFLWFCANSSSDDVKAALRQCASENFVRESGLTGYGLGLLHDIALMAFTHQIGAYKTEGKFREALELMEAVPMATAELYSRPATRGEDGRDEESDGEFEEGEEEDEEEKHDEKRVMVADGDETG
jgi:hypothetical protein